MSKFVKEKLIDETKNAIGDSRDILAVDVSRLTGNEVNAMRGDLAARGITVKSVKSSLGRIVSRQVGLDGFDGRLRGPTTLVWGGEDIVALSRELTAWVKKIDRLSILGACFEGKTLDSAGVEALSKSPGRAELIGRVVQLIQSPGGTLVGAIVGPGGRLQGQLSAKAE